jgi:hypothetical protein
MYVKPETAITVFELLMIIIILFILMPEEWERGMVINRQKRNKKQM